MRKLKIFILISVVSTFLPTNCLVAQTLKTGFKALEMHDYFRAKKIFNKKKKRQIAIASFGLASIFNRPNNVFQNIDSAHLYINFAMNNFDKVKSSKQKKFESYGFKLEHIAQMKQQIASEMFIRAVKENTEQGFIDFIAKNLSAVEVPLATFYRDSLAFQSCFADSHSERMTYFLNRYPTSEFASKAQDAFNKFQFEEQTQGKRKEDYEKFLENFPNNPFARNAEQALFRFAEDLNTVKGYEKFLLDYPTNSFRQQAWRALYKSYIRQNGLALIGEFKKNYPDYPFLQELDMELSLLNAQLFPFFLNGKWGFIDQNGSVRIQPKFDYLEMFSQGRAAALVGDLYGFIDPLGAWTIQPQFSDVSPFRFNLSVVFDTKGRAGVINLFGEWVLEPRFEDIQIINDDWLWVENELGWILYQISKNKFGIEHFKTISEFTNGFALVSNEEESSLIDLNENKLMTYSQGIERFGDLFLVHFNDSSALVNENNEQILRFDTYDFGNFNPEGLTPFLKDDFLGYLNREGNVVVKPMMHVYPNWESFAGFENEHAKAFSPKNKKYGLIDQNALWVIPAKYNDISFFSEILAVQINDQWEYINRQGQRLNIGLFDRAESFVNGSGIVLLNGAYGLINAQGEQLISRPMNRLLRLESDLLKWEDFDRKQWLSDNQGTLLFDQACDKIDRIDETIIQLVVKDEVYYFLIKEKRMVSLKRDE